MLSFCVPVTNSALNLVMETFNVVVSSLLSCPIWWLLFRAALPSLTLGQPLTITLGGKVEALLSQFLFFYSLILVEHILQWLPEKEYIGGNSLRPCLSKNIFILTSFQFGSLAEFRILGWTEFYVRILKALSDYLASSREIWGCFLSWSFVCDLFSSLGAFRILSLCSEFHDNVPWCDWADSHCPYLLGLWRAVWYLSSCSPAISLLVTQACRGISSTWTFPWHWFGPLLASPCRHPVSSLAEYPAVPGTE